MIDRTGQSSGPQKYLANPQMLQSFLENGPLGKELLALLAFLFVCLFACLLSNTYTKKKKIIKKMEDLKDFFFFFCLN